MKKLLGYLISCLLCTNVWSQFVDVAIKGSVTDSSKQKTFAYTTVSITQAKDSLLVAFTQADSTGKFTLKGIRPGKYLLSATYVGYATAWQPLLVNGTTDIIRADLVLKDLKSLNNEVTVYAKRPPVVLNKDTLEFNAENFNTQPNAVVEDLLKRLPGVTIDNDGTVKVNGQRVNRVLVNGKEFFTGDPTIATKNLTADAIDKVQVFDRKSDRSQFTGFEDGQTEKAINLKLKKDKSNALFGRTTAGVGNDKRFDAQSNTNYFNKEEQLSFLGMANNTNRQGFSMTDVLNFSGEMSRGMRSGGGGVSIRINTSGSDNSGLPVVGRGQNQQGVANTYAAGVNYSTKLKNKTELNINGVFSDIELNTIQNTKRQNILPNNAFNYFSNSNQINRAQQNKLSAIIDHSFDSSTSLRITPQITQQKQRINTQRSFYSENVKGLINEGNVNNQSASSAINAESEILFRKRLAKKGRTISVGSTLRFNQSEGDATIRTQNKLYFDNLPPFDSLQNQINDRYSNTKTVQANITYTEPLSKRSLLELSGFGSYFSGESQLNTFDFNSNSNSYSIKNQLLTNSFLNKFSYYGGSLALRTNFKKWSYNAGFSIQQSGLNSTNLSNKNIIEQNFTDILPNANIRYSILPTRNININYNTNVQQPNSTQLQPVANVSDPLNVYTGNPNLKRSYSHNVFISYTNISTFSGRNLFAFVNASVTNNAIVNADVVSANGVRTTMPVNVNGNYSLFANLSHGFPVKKLKSRFEIGLNTSLFNNISFINNQSNTIQNWQVGPNVNWNFSLNDVFDVFAQARITMNEAKYSLQSQLNNRFWQQNYNIEIINRLPWGITISNQLNYIVNTGRADGFNTRIPYWNSSVAKAFLKNKRGEIKISAFDLLNKNQGISRTANQNYIEDNRYNVLQRYFLLSFNYILNKSGKATSGPQMMIRSF